MSNGKPERISFLMPISKEVGLWIGDLEAKKLEHRSVHFPFFSTLVVLLCSLTFLTTVMRYFPGALEFVTSAIPIHWVDNLFPLPTRLYSYLAKKYQQPWDIVLSAILAINLVSCLIATVIFSFWVFLYPMTCTKEAAGRDLESIERSRAKVGRGVFHLLLIVAIVVFVASMGLLGGDLSRDYDQASSPAALVILLHHYTLLCLPVAVAVTVFLLKSWWMIKRLDAQRRKA